MSNAQVSAPPHNKAHPEVIYHYCSMESFVKIIESKEIWLTPSTHMNDATECRWLFSLAQRYAQENFVGSPEDISLANSFLDTAALNSRRNYMACFSQSRDLLSQWRGYADGGKGVAIGFKVASFATPIVTQPDWRTPKQEQFYLYKMHYPDYAEVLPLLEGIFGQIKSNDPELYGIVLSQLGPMFKNKSFVEENEWRFVVVPFLMGAQHANHWISRIIPIDHFKTRLTARGLSKYITYPILGEDQPEIFEVILGPQNPTWEDDLSFFLFKNSLPRVKIQRSESTFRG